MQDVNDGLTAHLDEGEHSSRPPESLVGDPLEANHCQSSDSMNVTDDDAPSTGPRDEIKTPDPPSSPPPSSQHHHQDELDEIALNPAVPVALPLVAVQPQAPAQPSEPAPTFMTGWVRPFFKTFGASTSAGPVTPAVPAMPDSVLPVVSESACSDEFASPKSLMSSESYCIVPTFRHARPWSPDDSTPPESPLSMDCLSDMLNNDGDEDLSDVPDEVWSPLCSSQPKL